MQEHISQKQNTIEEKYRRAHHWIKAREWTLALEELDQCLLGNPYKRKYTQLYSKVARHIITNHYKKLGEQLINKGFFEEAIKNYEYVLGLDVDQKLFKPLVRQAKKLHHEFKSIFKQASELFNQEKLTKAKRKIIEFLENAPECPHAQELLKQIETREHAKELYTKATKLYRDGEVQQAKKVLEASLSYDKHYSAPQVLLDRIDQELIKEDVELAQYEITSKEFQELADNNPMFLEDSILLLEEAAEIPISQQIQDEKAKMQN